MPYQSGAQEFDFSDAPGGDTSLDELFVNPEVPAEGTPTQEQQTTTTSEPFLKTATGTVYNSADDAIKGIEHKDAYILDLKQKLAEAQEGRKTAPVQTSEVTDESYTANPDKYFKDMAEAKSREDALKIQQRFIQEQLSPYAPVIAGMAKTSAVDNLSHEIPTIREFIGSEDYTKTLDRYPLLKQSIQQAEGNPQLSSHLSQLYRMAFTTAAGENMSKVVAPAQRDVAARPTVSSTTTPPPNTNRGPAPSMNTSEGRKATMTELEQRGLLDVRF